jgi:hypothetical protein
MMNWKGYGRKWSWPSLRYYPSIYLEGLRKNLNQGREDSIKINLNKWGVSVRERRSLDLGYGPMASCVNTVKQPSCFINGSK